MLDHYNLSMISFLLLQVTLNQMYRGTKITRLFLKIEESNFCAKMMACAHSWSEILRLRTEGNINVLQAIRKERYSVVVNCLSRVSWREGYLAVLILLCC